MCPYQQAMVSNHPKYPRTSLQLQMERKLERRILGNLSKEFLLFGLEGSERADLIAN